LGTLVDLEDAPTDLVAVEAHLDERAVEQLDPDALPGWDATPPGVSVRFAEAWFRERRSVVLRVPSVMIPSEWNYVLNPEHPDFGKVVRIVDARPFMFDERLLRRR
jgi:RES domain-containing protein